MNTASCGRNYNSSHVTMGYLLWLVKTLIPCNCCNHDKKIIGTLDMAPSPKGIGSGCNPRTNISSLFDPKLNNIASRIGFYEFAHCAYCGGP